MAYGDWQSGGNGRNARRSKSRAAGGSSGGYSGGKGGGKGGNNEKWKPPRGSYVVCAKAACKNWGQYGDKADWSCPQCGTAYDWQGFWQNISGAPAAPRQQQQQQRQQQQERPESSAWGYRSDGYWEALGEEDEETIAERDAANKVAEEDEQMAEGACKEAEEAPTQKGPTWRAEKAKRSAKAKSDNEAKEKTEDEAEEARSEWYDAGTRVSHMRKEQAKVRTRLDKLLGEIDDQLSKVATADSDLAEAVDDATCLEKVWRDKVESAHEAMRSRDDAQAKKVEASKAAAAATSEEHTKPVSPPTTPKAAPKRAPAAAPPAVDTGGSSCPGAGTLLPQSPASSACCAASGSGAAQVPAKSPEAQTSAATIVVDDAGGSKLALPGILARAPTAGLEDKGADSCDDGDPGVDAKSTDISCDDVDLWRSALVHWIWYARPDETPNKEVLAWTDIWGGDKGEEVKQEFANGAIYARDQLAAKREEFRLEWRKAQDLTAAGDTEAARQLAWQIEAYGDRLKEEYGSWLGETITAKIDHLLAQREAELLNGTNPKRPKSFQYDMAPKRKGNKGKGKGSGGKATAGGKGPRAEVEASKSVIKKGLEKEKGFLFLDKVADEDAA